MLINGRYYFDFNATSPLSPSVKEWLVKGDFVFGNPSSVHTSGKKSLRLIANTRDYLTKTFSLENHQLFFTSGASESINTLLRGAALETKFTQKKTFHFFFFQVDHSCVYNQQEEFDRVKIDYTPLPINADGSMDPDVIIKIINQSSAEVKLLNWTWVNNETGVIHPLEDALKIKEATGALVHVDAVQAIGKIIGFTHLLEGLDAYSFSGHKFGALKGVGFSFVSADFPFWPLIRGGGQQNTLRSGTENPFGIYSLELALKDLLEKFNPKELGEGKAQIERAIAKALENKGRLIASDNKLKSLTTISFILNDLTAEKALILFDMHGIDISSGSACSSGSIRPSRVLLAMGLDEKQAKSALRVSFSPFMSIDQADDYKNRLLEVLEKS